MDAGVVGQWFLEQVGAGHAVLRPELNARAYIETGDKDKAFDWLEKSWENPLWGTENAPSSPRWDPLRDDPRFEELLRKQNLPEEVIQKHLALPTN